MGKKEEAEKEEGYVPGPDFKEDIQEPLFDIQMNDTTHLWLLQLPDDYLPDFNGQEISLDLDQDELSSLKAADGKVYSLVNFPADVAETTVFQSSPSGTRVVGNISRHVSLVHFPEPDELESLVSGSKKRMPLSSKTTYTKSQFSTPPRSIIKKKVQSGSKGRSTHTSRKSTQSEVGEPSRHSGQSAQNSRRSQGSVTISGSSEQSHRKKSKVKI